MLHGFKSNGISVICNRDNHKTDEGTIKMCVCKSVKYVILTVLPHLNNLRQKVVKQVSVVAFDVAELCLMAAIQQVHRECV